MQADNPKLKAAIVKARNAEEEEARQRYKVAFELYKDAVAILIPLINGTSNLHAYVVSAS